MINEMPDSIENYTPQRTIAGQRRQAFWVWGITLWVVLIWVFAIIAAPLAKINGFSNFSDSIYSFFSHICHQMSSRSFHIHEHQLAVCARCFGFYAGFLLGIGAYPLFRSPENTDSFPRFWLFAAMIPIAVDWSLTFFGIWENTHLSRTITGGILGIACAIFIIPALVEINLFISGKFQRKS